MFEVFGRSRLTRLGLALIKVSASRCPVEPFLLLLGGTSCYSIKIVEMNRREADRSPGLCRANVASVVTSAL